jgi:hypothetical protein
MFGETKFFFDYRSLEQSQDSDIPKSRPHWVESVTKSLKEDRGVNLESAYIGRHWDHWQTLGSLADYLHALLIQGTDVPGG